MHHGDVEAQDGINGTLDEAQVDGEVAIGHGTHHHAAGDVAVEALEGQLASLLSLRGVVALIIAVLGTVEELGNLVGQRWQFAVVGQLVAQTDIGIGTDVAIHDAGVEVDEGERTALLLVRLAQIEMPLGFLVFLAAGSPCDLHVKRDGGAHLGQPALLLRLRGIGHRAGIFLGTGRSGFFLVRVARRILGIGTYLAAQSLLAVGDDFLELVAGQHLHLVLDGTEVGTEGIHGSGHRLGAERSIHRDIQLQVAVALGVLIDEGHLGIDDATHALDVSGHVEGGEALALAVIDDVEREVALECLAVGRGHTELHEDTDESGHVLGLLVVALRVARAVHVEAAAQLGDGTGAKLYLAVDAQMHPSPGVALLAFALTFVFKVSSVAMDSEEVARQLDVELGIEALADCRILTLLVELYGTVDAHAAERGVHADGLEVHAIELATDLGQVGADARQLAANGKRDFAGYVDALDKGHLTGDLQSERGFRTAEVLGDFIVLDTELERAQLFLVRSQRPGAGVEEEGGIAAVILLAIVEFLTFLEETTQSVFLLLGTLFLDVGLDVHILRLPRLTVSHTHAHEVDVGQAELVAHLVLSPLLDGLLAANLYLSA